MKKLILVSVILLAALAGALGFEQYRASFHPVTITIKNPAGSMRLALYKAVDTDDGLSQVGQSLRTITASQTLSLQKGNYVLLPSGDHVSTTPIELVVGDQPVTQTVDIDYTTEYLNGLLQQELPAITASLTAAYPNLLTNYTISSGKLLGRGEWFGTTLVNKVGPLEDINGDTLRVLLEKKNGSWMVVSKPPAIILTAPDYPQVPIKVLQAVNQL